MLILGGSTRGRTVPYDFQIVTFTIASCRASFCGITIEPGAYIQGFGGVRIEDTVLVTERGCEVLTPTSKEFVNL